MPLSLLKLINAKNAKLMLIIGSYLLVALCTWWIADDIHEGHIAKIKQEAAEARIQAIAKARKHEEEDAKASADSAESHAKIVEKIVYRDRIKTKRVIEYVEAVPDACDLDGRWVREHDYFASSPGVSEATDSASGTDEAITGASAAQVLDTVGNNYQLYHRCRARHQELVNWVQKACM